MGMERVDITLPHWLLTCAAWPYARSLGGGQDSSLSWPSSEALVASVLDELQDRADEHVLRSRFGL